VAEPTVECPYCHTQNPDDTETCVSCGKPIPKAESMAPINDGGEIVDVDSVDIPEDAGDIDDSGEYTITPEEVLSEFRNGQTEAPSGTGQPPEPSETELPPAAAQPTPPPVNLQPGMTLGDRYRIEDVLGSGGMGAVYRARDLELDREVALKVIRPHLAEDQDIIKRFKQEIILSREVTHRNVVRIYDLGQADDIRFISMEYVEGTDLSHTLRKRGALPVEEAVSIVEQVCLALDAAHSEGVVHRDLKPQNIMTEPDGRVVVMDFGIARSLELSGMTATGSLLGTPDYMSPEQVKGERVDARADLFALGVILYQLLTGELPYKGETPMAAMYTRTQTRPPPIRDLNPELPGFLGDVVGRCLEIQIHRRYQSAREVLQDLSSWRGGPTHMTLGPTMMRGLKPTTTKAQNLLRIAIIGGAAVVALALVVGGVMWVRSRSAAPATAEAQAVVAPADVVSLAILPFRNASEDAELSWLGSGLSEMLRTDVGQTASLRSVSSDRVHQILRDLRIAPDTSLEEVTLRRIAEFANADTVVWGQFVRLGELIRIDATVRDFERHTTVPLSAEVPNEQQLLRAVQELAQGVRDNLALSSEAVEEMGQQAFIPSASSVVALRHYNEGLELMRQGNNLEAVTSLETAVEGDPNFALAHSELAQAYLQLGRGQKAEEAARTAVDLSDDLPTQERYLILAQSARVERDYEQGIDAYQNLLQTRPADGELNYELAVLYEEGGSFDLAREHLQSALEADPQNLTAHLATGRVFIKSGNPQDSLAPLNQALSLAIQVDNKEARANTLQAIGVAYRMMGRLEDALKNYEESLEIKREIGDQRGMAASLSEIAIIQHFSGKPNAAREIYRNAIEITREIGDDHGLARNLQNLGEVERINGNYDSALENTREALRIQMELGDEWNQALSLNNIGTIYELKGEYAESLIYYQRSLELRKRLGDPSRVADTLHNLAETYTALGNFDEAVDHYLQALEQRRAAADELGAAAEQYSLGRTYGYQGRYGASLHSIEEALEIYRRSETRDAWYVEILAGYGDALGLLGRFDEAQPVLDEALGLAREADSGELIAQILDLDGDRLLYQSSYSAAAARYQEAIDAATAIGDPLVELAARANLGRAELMAGQPRKALPMLEASLREARSRGLKYLVARCSIGVGSALLATGDGASAEEQFRNALRGAEELGSQVLLAKSHHMLSETLISTGRSEDAARHAERAARHLEEIRTEAGTEQILERADLKPIADAAPPAPATE
jgi:tetratricopeptide (TPR) repeat protein/predicted Ser/Thr protein kinase